MQRLKIFLGSLALLAFVGCSASRELTSAMASATRKEHKSPKVSRVVCLWEPAVGKIPNGPKRGIIGQVLFFEGRDTAPVKVDGEVVIYVFDDHGSIEDQSKPIHKLALSPEELKAVHAETAVGHSYHIPVPYPKDHGLTTTCTMRVKHTSVDGHVSYSDLASVLLLGKSRPSSTMKVKREIAPVSELSERDISQAQNRPSKTIGRTEIHETDAGDKQLKTLTIRQHETRMRSRARGERTEPLQPRKRFRLSNATTPASDDKELLEKAFAPLEETQ